MICTDAGVSSTRFCRLIDMPERSGRRWQAKTRAGGQADAGDGLFDSENQAAWASKTCSTARSSPP